MTDVDDVYKPGVSQAWQPNREVCSLVSPHTPQKYKNFALPKFNAGFFPAFFLPPKTGTVQTRNEFVMPAETVERRFIPNDFSMVDPESVRDAISAAVMRKSTYASSPKYKSSIRNYACVNEFAYIVMKAGAPVNSSGEFDPEYQQMMDNNVFYIHEASSNIVTGYKSIDPALDVWYSRGLPATLDRIVPYQIKGLFPYENTKTRRVGLNCLRKGLPYTTEWRSFDAPTVFKCTGLNIINNLAASKNGHKVLSNAISYIFGDGDTTYRFIKSVLLNNIGFKPIATKVPHRNIYNSVMASRFHIKMNNSIEDPGYDPWGYDCFASYNVDVTDRTSIYRAQTPGVYTSKTTSKVKYNCLAGLGRTHTHLAQPILRYNNTGVVEYLGFIQILRMFMRSGDVDYSRSHKIRSVKAMFGGMHWYNTQAASVREYVMRMRLRLIFMQMYVEIVNELPPEEMLEAMKLKVSSKINTEIKLGLLNALLEERWDYHWRTQFGFIHLINKMDVGIGNTEFAANIIHVILLMHIEHNPRVLSYLFNYLLYNVTLCDNKESLCKVIDVWAWLRSTPYWNDYSRDRVLSRAKILTKFDSQDDPDTVFKASMWSDATSRALVKRYILSDTADKEDTSRAKRVVKEVSDTYAKALNTLEELVNRVKICKVKLQGILLNDYKINRSDQPVVNDVVISKEMQFGMYNALINAGFAFLGGKPNDLPEDLVIIGITAKRLMILMKSLMPLQALALVARNTNDLCDLSIVNSIWAGFNNPIIGDAFSFNSGTMPMTNKDGSRNQLMNPLPILEGNLKLSKGFKYLDAVDTVEGMLDAFNARELVATKLAGLANVYSTLFEENICTTHATAVYMHLVRKILNGAMFDSHAVCKAMRQELNAETYKDYMSSVSAKQVSPFMYNKTLHYCNHDRDVADMHTRLIAIGLFANADAYRNTVKRGEVNARTRLRALSGLYPQLRDLLQEISREQYRKQL